MEVDFIIVGQGLAGTLLSYELLRMGKSVMVYEDPESSGATSVAAGLINPVVFRRMIKSWGVDLSYGFVESTYKTLENLLGEKFFYPCQLLKILNEQTADTWEEKVAANQLEYFAQPQPDMTYRHHDIHAPFGVGIILKAGRVDLQKLTHYFSLFLQQKQCIRHEEFNYLKLETVDTGVRYNEIMAQKIVFCEGPFVSRNPYFSELKFKHSKGELLELKIPHIKLREIISNDIFIIPLGHDQYKVGATYSWDDLSVFTSPAARDELLIKLEKTLEAPIEIIDQKAGIRPTMHDRKPVAGFHPHNPSIGILNGLGSKGSLLAPWLASQMAELMCGHITSLHPEIHINRYFNPK